MECFIWIVRTIIEWSSPDRLVIKPRPLSSVIDIQRIIAHLCGLDIGVLITDHNVRETLDICHRAYIVNDGNLIAEGTPESILHNEHVREVYLGHNFRL